jgi:lysophospholipase L1-like esterase
MQNITSWIGVLGFGLLPTAVCNAQPTGPRPFQEILVPPQHSKLLYTGRWDFSNPVVPNCGWQGSSISVRFHGTSVSAVLDAGNFTEYFRIIVDGDVSGSRKIAVANSPERYRLVSGLAPGPHELTLVKETYAGTNATFFGFAVQGTLLDRPTRPPRKLEFYGDSNLAGYSLEHEQNNGANSMVGSTLGYAGITARMLNAEYHNVSDSGATISSLHNRFDRINYWSPNPAWDFNQYPADAVVVNLGANDVGRPKNVIKNDYHQFLDDLRALHPSAHILLFNAWGWDDNEPANFTHEVITERSDPNMSFAIFPWLFEQWHGCEYDHAGMAVVLAEHLQSVLGWTPKPADVVSGYGIGGDVANGSFEFAAPFGGFCWRYAGQNGVQRLQLPAQAKDGDWFLRLSQGDAIHQPHPAVDGDTFTAMVWLRGAQAGDELDLSLDFRNQNMFSTPLQSTTQRKALTTQWQLYSVTATAPVGATDPVYHTRLTLQPAPGSTVDVDLVSMTRN